MSKQITEPTTIIKVTFTCDRCGKVEQVDHDTAAAGEVRDIPTGMPEGWVEVSHPNGVDPALTFDRRACTSTWFSGWVRRLYGAPEPGPRKKKVDEEDAPKPKRVKAEPEPVEV